jgi:hypothetical protein
LIFIVLKKQTTKEAKLNPVYYTNKSIFFIDTISHPDVLYYSNIDAIAETSHFLVIEITSDLDSNKLISNFKKSEDPILKTLEWTSSPPLPCERFINILKNTLPTGTNWHTTSSTSWSNGTDPTSKTFLIAGCNSYLDASGKPSISKFYTDYKLIILQ